MNNYCIYNLLSTKLAVSYKTIYAYIVGGRLVVYYFHTAHG